MRFSKSILIASPDSSTKFHASVNHFWRRFQSSQNSCAQTAMKRANQTVHLLSKRLVNLTNVHDSRISTNWQLFAGPSHLGHKSRLSLHIARPTGWGFEIKIFRERFRACLEMFAKSIFFPTAFGSYQVNEFFPSEKICRDFEPLTGSSINPIPPKPKNPRRKTRTPKIAGGISIWV